MADIYFPTEELSKSFKYKDDFAQLPLIQLIPVKGASARGKKEKLSTKAGRNTYNFYISGDNITTQDGHEYTSDAQTFGQILVDKYTNFLNAFRKANTGLNPESITIADIRSSYASSTKPTLQLKALATVYGSYSATDLRSDILRLRNDSYPSITGSTPKDPVAFKISDKTGALPGLIGLDFVFIKSVDVNMFSPWVDGSASWAEIEVLVEAALPPIIR